MMNAWTNRAKQRMKELKLTHQDIADRLEVSRASITHYLSGRREPSLNQLIEWSAILKTSPAWLQFGVETSQVDLPNDKNIKPAAPLAVHLPVISWLDASQWEQLKEDYRPSNETEWIPYAGSPIEGAFALKIRGDSMQALYGVSFIENSYIIVAPHRMAQHEDFVLICLKNEEEALLRQLILEGKKQFFKPLNPRYPIIEMKAGIRLCGVVCQAFHPL
jgi:SOS-response transcriptional repressor LexA